MLTADPIKLSNRLNKSRKAVKTREEVSSPTQKKARDLLDREKAIEKSSRLFILLNQQYIAKYGTKSPHSDVNDAITCAIRDFLERDGNPTTSRLKTLEDQVRDIGQNYRKNLASAAAEKKQREQEMALEQRQQEEKAIRDAYVRPHLTHDEATQWSVLTTLQALSFEEKNAEEKRKLDKKGADYRHALKEQIASQEERTIKAREERLREAREVERLAQLHAEEEKRKEERKAQKFLTDRDIILSQIAERNKQREDEKKETIAFQQREMARAQRLLEEEEREREEERRRQKEAHDRLIIENEKDKAMKKKLMEERRLEEQRMQAEYEAKLEREERARAMAFQNRMDGLAKIGNSFETTGAGAIAKENARKEEMRMLEDIRKKELADKEREEAKIRKAKQDMLDAKASNQKIVQRKQEALEREKQQEREIREKYLRDAAENEKEKQEYMERKKNAARALKQRLDEQVNETTRGRSRTAKEALTDIELKINQDIIKKIENDPDLQERIVQRINAAPAKRDTGFKYG